MAIDHQTEELIPFLEAREAFPGRKVSTQTLHRWRLNGVKGIKLETCVVGGKRFTSREAIDRFFSAQNSVEQSSQASQEITPAQRRTQAETADRLLAEAGI